MPCQARPLDSVTLHPLLIGWLAGYMFALGRSHIEYSSTLDIVQLACIPEPIGEYDIVYGCTPVSHCRAALDLVIL